MLFWLLAACTAPKPDAPSDDGPSDDGDDDGYGASEDCDDANAAVHPDAIEVCNADDDDCDGGIDEDLSATWWADADADGYGGGTPDYGCDPPAGSVDNGADCDDEDAAVHPGAAEICNDADDDCDGLADNDPAPWYTDADGDGWGDPATGVETCSPAADQVADATDCDDADAAVNPGAEEVCDRDDDDCDGRADLGEVSTWHPDTDGDGYGHMTTAETTCAPPEGWVLDGTDCRPGDAEAYPGAPERCNDDDDDCDRAIDEDFELDGDGHLSTACDGDDCDDLAADIFPGAEDLCSDGVDQDCDGRDMHCDYGGTYDLASADAKVYSDEANFDAGRQVDVGDVDGDGINDVVVAVMYADGYNGGAYVLPGPLSGTSTLDAAGFRIEGARTTYGAGRSIGVGDVNADGYADVGVGAPDTTCIQWITFGPLTGDVDLLDADVERIGTYASETGHGADIGDVNGDGIDDLVTGAYEDDEGGYNAGAVFIEYGPFSVGSAAIADVSDAKLIGESVSAYAGRYVRAGHDVDGDGADDILAAAPYATSTAPYAGAAYLVYGGVTGDVDLASADGKYLGEAYGDYAGEGLGMGDVNGDGLADILLGSYDSSSVYYGGAAYVVFGPATGEIVLSAADVVIRGGTASQQLGIGLSAGDIDGDGVDELAIGAPGDLSGAGAAYLFFGPASATFTLPDADAIFLGEAAGDGMGQTLIIGDLDGDALGELVFGAPGEATGGSAAGAVYVQYADE